LQVGDGALRAVVQPAAEPPDRRRHCSSSAPRGTPPRRVRSCPDLMKEKMTPEDKQLHGRYRAGAVRDRQTSVLGRNRASCWRRWPRPAPSRLPPPTSAAATRAGSRTIGRDACRSAVRHGGARHRVRRTRRLRER
jgi:hypothetical protein